MILKVEDYLPSWTSVQSDDELSRPLETNFSQTGLGCWTTKERANAWICLILGNNCSKD